jgi:uncharacterized NAD(P)/FAD-binding protein YdhS
MRIAIIGGGASGALTALHLARALPAGTAEIIVIEPAEEIGRGLAYSTDDPGHLLNVRAANMSAFADQPDHLFRWLQTKGPCDARLTPLCFISRSMYGAYVADLVRALSAPGGMRHVRERCVDLVETGNSVVLTLETGSSIVADIAILATGNDGRPVLNGIPAVQPWAEDARKNLSAELPVLLIGTGLTMMDMALSLDRQGHRGKIIALSSRGLLSQVHRPVKPIVVRAKDVPLGTELSKLALWLRRLCTTVMSQSGDWRSAIDALRPHTQRIWRSMSVVQRRRFVRHARAYWDVHRHRLAPEVQTQLCRLRAAGRLEIVAGRVVDAEQRKDAIAIKMVRRGQNKIETCNFARVVDCTGLIHDPRRSLNPLIRSLLARGAARPDSLGIGLDIDEEYSLIDAWSRRSSRVRAIGPLTRAAFWECIAIPDIRMQCADLAELIAKAPPSGARSIHATAARTSLGHQMSVDQAEGSTQWH